MLTPYKVDDRVVVDMVVVVDVVVDAVVVVVVVVVDVVVVDVVVVDVVVVIPDVNDAHDFTAYTLPGSGPVPLVMLLHDFTALAPVVVATPLVFC